MPGIRGSIYDTFQAFMRRFARIMCVSGTMSTAKSQEFWFNRLLYRAVSKYTYMAAYINVTSYGSTKELQLQFVTASSSWRFIDYVFI